MQLLYVTIFHITNNLQTSNSPSITIFEKYKRFFINKIKAHLKTYSIT